MNNALLVRDFIDQIWNKRNFNQLDRLLDPAYKDYSLPPVLPADAEGTLQWIVNTGKSFTHHTLIEDQVTEGNLSIIRITMNLKHIGVWRDIEPTGMELTTTGYRQFTLRAGKIITHRALIDGQSIENQLNKAAHGCQLRA